MIRPFTLLAALLAMASGAYLFAVKHRAQVLDDQLAAVSEQSRLDGQRIRVLQAQWALEIDPTRLNQLATQFTSLQPMKPAQLVTLAALGQTLPPPGAAAPGQNPEGVGQPDEAAYDTVIATNGLPLPPPAAPPANVAVAAAAASPIPAVLAAAAAPAPKPAVAAAHPVRLAARRNTRQTVRLAQNSPAPAYAQPYPAYESARPGLTAVAVPAAAVITPARETSSAPAPMAQPGGSMLGTGAAALPPPQPYGAN